MAMVCNGKRQQKMAKSCEIAKDAEGQVYHDEEHSAM